MKIKRQFLLASVLILSLSMILSACGTKNEESSLNLDIQKKTITGASDRDQISTYAVLEDGTVIGEGLCDDEVKTWTDIVSVAASPSGNALYGLKSNGTVVCTESGHHECEKWTDIVDISAWGHVVGLRSNGTVVATGGDTSRECNVRKWNNIVAISAGVLHTVGLKSDGTVIATGDNWRGACEVQDWTDIVAIAAGWGITVGLKSDGTVVSTMETQLIQDWASVKSWTDIVSISVYLDQTAGLRSDGTVVATKLNAEQTALLQECTDTAAIFMVGERRLICLKSDGMVEEPIAVEPDEDELDCIRNRWDIMWPTNARVSRSFLYQEGIEPVWDEEIPGDGELTFYVTVINEENTKAKTIRTYKLHTTGDKDVGTALAEMNQLTYGHMTNRGPLILSVLGTWPTTELPAWTFYNKGVPAYEWATKVEDGEHYIFRLT